MQKYLHMSKKSSTFVSDFNSGIYNTLKYQRVMSKLSKTVTLGNREKVKTYQVRRKKAIVWMYVTGPFKGMYYVSCSLYPEFNKLYQTEELATKRAENIVSFHNRQLEMEVGL